MWMIWLILGRWKVSKKREGFEGWLKYFAQSCNCCFYRLSPTNRLWRYWSNLDKHQDLVNLAKRPQRRKSQPLDICLEIPLNQTELNMGTWPLGHWSPQPSFGKRAPLPMRRYIHFPVWVGLALSLGQLMLPSFNKLASQFETRTGSAKYILHIYTSVPLEFYPPICLLPFSQTDDMNCKVSFVFQYFNECGASTVQWGNWGH